MTIQVFGSGCPSCKRLYEMTKVAVSEEGLSVDVEYIPDVQKMVEMGIMQSPALLINGTIALSGRIPGMEDLKEIIASHRDS